MKQIETIIQQVELLENIQADITDELVRAIKKYPTFPVDLIYQSAIIAEESGELIQACLDYVLYKEVNSTENIRLEVIQTAAMCLRMLIHLK